MALFFRKSTLKSPELLDKAGAAASFLCAIHCAIMPLVLTLAPLMMLSVLASETIEWVLFVLSAILGTTSICWGYRLHRSRKAIAILACGLALLSAGRILHQHHAHVAEAHSPALVSKSGSAPHAGGPDLYTIILVAGGLAVMSSHIINHRLCKHCKKCSDAACQS